MFEQIRITRAVIGPGTDRLMQLDASAPQEALSALAGQARLVYADPPFATGEVFRCKRPYGASGWARGKPTLLMQGFSDQYSREAYDRLLRGLIENARSLLSEEGMFALHLDWRSSARARLIAEEVFGEEQFINEIIWTYESGGRAKKWFSRKHDTILLFARDAQKYRFNLEKVPIPRDGKRRNHMRRGTDENGRAYSAITVGDKEYRYYDDEPTYPSDVWTDVSHLQQRDPERTGWPTQKPLMLLERLIRPVCEPSDLVVDLCCGSGTTLTAARGLGCRSAGCDLSREAIAFTAYRLGGDLDILAASEAEGCHLSGDCSGGMVLLTGLDAPFPGFPAPANGLEAMESWACGRIGGDGVFRADTLARRTRRTPDLPQMLPLPGGEGTPAVLCFDAAGRMLAFAWRQDAG